MPVCSLTLDNKCYVEKSNMFGAQKQRRIHSEVLKLLLGNLLENYFRLNISDLVAYY